MTKTMEKIKIPSSKGNIAAIIHYPGRKTEQLAILCPGFLDSKDYKHLLGLANELSKLEYTVVRFDPIGTWESEGEISDYTTTQYLGDIKTVLEYMLKQSEYEYILLGGHNRGGMISILYAARDHRISLVLGIMPSSKRTKAGKRYEEWKEKGVSISFRDLPDEINKKREFIVPFSHAQDTLKYDVVEDVKKIKIPIILIAGEQDELVPPEYVKEIFDNANEPKTFFTIPCIGHDYRLNDKEVKLVNKEILKLIR